MIEVCLEKVESSVNKIDLRIDQVESKVYKNRTEIRIFNRINYSNIITHIKDNLFEEKKKKLFLKHYIAFFFSSIK